MNLRIMLSIPQEQYLVFHDIGNGLFVLLDGFCSEDGANKFIENLQKANDLEET